MIYPFRFLYFSAITNFRSLLKNFYCNLKLSVNASTANKHFYHYYAGLSAVWDHGKIGSMRSNARIKSINATFFTQEKGIARDLDLLNEFVRKKLDMLKASS